MAYITADRTREIARELKAAFPKIKFSVRNEHHSTVRVSIMSAPMHFDVLQRSELDTQTLEQHREHHGINHHYLNHYAHVDILTKIFAIVNKGNHDNSDAQSDYFDVGFYVDISVGKWNKPFVLTK